MNAPTSVAHSKNLPGIRADEIIGTMARALPFPLEANQRGAWRYLIKLLRSLVDQLPSCTAFFESIIPGMGSLDRILVCGLTREMGVDVAGRA